MSGPLGVPEFYAGESIFITGGTGFLGKVLIEKLLRSCHDIKNIYMLMRPKKELQLEQRLKKMYELPLFDVLRKERPDDFEKKVIAINGDVAELGLGISESDRIVLIENVSMVIHAAATVRFDQPLNEAILMNTRGTREACQLALELKTPKFFLHISTAYAHIDKKCIEEKLYPPHANWKEAIEIAETMDPLILKIITPKFMEGFPNTYTFTKSMAENVVNDLLSGKISNIVFRPSIVVNTQKDPFPGWIDNFNGPMGLFVASGSGLNRISLVSDVRADYVSVDGCTKAMLIGMWHEGTKGDAVKKSTIVYNASSNNVQPMTMHNIIKIAIDLSWQYPISSTLWYPTSACTSSITIYYIYVILFHMIPAYFLDIFLKILNHKPMIVRLQRRIYQATMALKYFILNEWTIKNDNVINLERKLHERDREAFGYGLDSFEIRVFFANALIGAKTYLLKDKAEDLEGYRAKFRRFYYMDLVLQYVSYGFVFYVLFIRHNIIKYMLGLFTSYIDTL